jgi:hypothetical protein
MRVSDDKFFHAKIAKRVEFAEDLWMIRIQPGGEFNFIPGQYATLGLMHEDKRIERPYSIASAPFEEEVEIFIELVPEGALTPRLYALQPGDEVLMRKIPKGKFTLDTESGRKHHLLVSTVTGVSPFVSFVRSLSKDWKEGRFDGSHHLYLLNGASRPLRRGTALVHLCAHGEPPVGSRGLAGRDWPRGRRAAQICRPLGARCDQYDCVLVRTSRHDREQQGDLEKAWIPRPKSGQGRDLLDPAAIIRR